MRTAASHKRTRRGKRGVALILALMFVVLLTVMVVEFSYETQVEASFAMNQGGDFKAYLAAKSAVMQGVSLLAQDLLDTEMNGEAEYDSLLDPVPWYNGVPFRQLNQATMHASISDEYGKLNLNALLDHTQDPPVENEQMVNAMIAFFTLRDTGKDASPEAIVDAILDWLDYNDDDEVRTEGAENEYYNSLEIPFSCHNGPMDSIEELLCIKGITPLLYFGDPELEQLPLSEYLTVHGDWYGRVNINTAREEVTAALIAGYTDMPPDIAIGQDIAEEVLENPFMDINAMMDFVTSLAPELQNIGNQETAQRQQQQILKQKQNSLVQNLAGAQTQGDMMPQQFSGVQQLFMINSYVFRIYGDGMEEDLKVRVEAFVWRTPLEAALTGAIPGLSDLVGNTQGAELPGNLADATGQLESGGMPAEPLRLLDWRVIR